MGTLIAVAGLVVAGLPLVLTDDEPPPPPPDDILEIVDFEFDRVTLDLNVTGYFDPGETSPYPAPSNETAKGRALVITFRNTSDSPAFLTGLKVSILEITNVRTCGAGTGGGSSPSLNYDFRFPSSLDGAWNQTNPQNFVVAPQSTDALSVTIGPDKSPPQFLVWRFSIFATFANGEERYLGDAIGTEEMPDGDYEPYVWGAISAGKSLQRNELQHIRDCAKRTAATLEPFIAPRGSARFSVDPAASALVGAFRAVAQPNSKPR